jgi:S1-C subfamily serine protease
MLLVVSAAAILVIGVAYHFALAAHAAHGPSEKAPVEDVRAEVRELTQQVEQLKQELAAPSVVLNRYRNSIGYIYGAYHVGFGKQTPKIRMRISGTGFLVGSGLVATNRHVAEPWYGDPDAKGLIDRGATPTLEDLVVYFPDSPNPIRLLPGSVSKTSDLAVLRMEHSDGTRNLPVLPLAGSPGPAGQMVVVIGYPLGTQGMVAKSPSQLYERLAFRHNDIDTVSKLAAMSLIRPSTTYGHLGDIVGDKIVYDASSAHGGSGGPVLNSRGEVIGVNFAYMDGFSGSTLGISVNSLRPLLQEVSATNPTHTPPSERPN